MHVTILGKSRFDFKDENGVRLCGTKLHYSYNDPSVDGVAVATKSFHDSDHWPFLNNVVLPGAVLDFEYGPKNKLMNVTAVPQSSPDSSKKSA